MKIFGKEVDKDKFLYTGLIFTFIVLYAVTAFVSFYHAITFFNIANAVWLSILLSFVAEIGQASVLFAILLTDNKHKFLPWVVMVILTTLQVIGNVVSSYDWIIDHNGAGVESFQKSILFWMTAADPEIFKVVIAWISGALLPIIALSMTALVAQNMELRAHDARTNLDIEPEQEEKTPELIDNSPIKSTEEIESKDLIGEIAKIRPTEDDFKKLEDFLNLHIKPKTKEEVINEIIKEEEKINKEIDVVHDDGQEPDEDIEPDDDEFGPVDLTNVEPDILPDYKIKTDNGLAENIEIKPSIIESVFNSAQQKIDEIPEDTPPIIEPEKKIQETPEPIKEPVTQQSQHLTQEQLEKIRQIAKDNLKKK